MISTTRVSISSIRDLVGEVFGVTNEQMCGNQRGRNVARPRQIAMYLAYLHTRHSTVEIGRHFGDRDHTTVIHAVRRVRQFISSDESIANDMQRLTETILNRMRAENAPAPQPAGVDPASVREITVELALITVALTEIVKAVTELVAVSSIHRGLHDGKKT